MIPKIIHYCWFGRNPLPKSAVKCINSWKKFFPGYEIKEWNEDNFDVNITKYTKEAYEAKKYAFVSDYVRFWAIYNFGGLYFDTDVEVISSFDKILEMGAFMGIERMNVLLNSKQVSFLVNPGLGLGAEKHLMQFGEIIQHYNNISFLDENGAFIPLTVVHHTTKLLDKYGFNHKNIEQKCGDIIIYPSEVLCPMDGTTGVLDITNNTLSIHHYSCSWINHNSISYKLHLIKIFFIRYTGKLGIKLMSCLKNE